MKSNPVDKVQAASSADPIVQSVADEITRYLASHPTAANTLGGIGTQWLPPQRATEQQVRAAIELLIAQGKLPNKFNRFKSRLSPD
jgi:hypothetical protein